MAQPLLPSNAPLQGGHAPGAALDAAPGAAPDAASAEANAAAIDARAWLRLRRQWARAERLPWLHTEVARRMAERLPAIRQVPERMIEWDAGAGQSRSVLAQAYRKADWLPVEEVGVIPAGSPPKAPWWRRWLSSEAVAALGSFGSGGTSGSAASALPVVPAVAPAAASALPAQLLWSNMGLHTHAQPRLTLAQWHAALAVDGFLMFSTFGPDTVRELRALWASRGWGPAGQDFMDMHDWGDELVHAGFADPVMDQETVTLTWPTPEAALSELRTLGVNAHLRRHAGCRTPAWRRQMLLAMSDLAGPDGRIRLTFEIVYGHAFRPAPRPRLAPVTSVSLDDMRALVQTARRAE